jgi:hypothetical protein
MFYVVYIELLVLIFLLICSRNFICFSCLAVSAPHFLTNAQVGFHLLNVISDCRKLFQVYLSKTPNRITDSDNQQSSAFV